MTLNIDDHELLSKASRTLGRGWKKKLATLIVKHARAAVGMDADMSPAEVAAELGCTTRTVMKRRKEGYFPGAYAINQRVFRIPVADVKRLKESRLLSIQ